VRDAVPFALGDASLPAFTHAEYQSLWPAAATGTSQCVWTDVGADGPLEFVPGGAWMHEARIPLEGEPYTLDGALSTALDTNEQWRQVSAYIDGSREVVSVRPPPESGIEAELVAVNVIKALVGEF